MKQVIERVTVPAVFSRIVSLFTPLARRRDIHRKGRADSLSRHMRRDIGLGDDARGTALYGPARRPL